MDFDNYNSNNAKSVTQMLFFQMIFSVAVVNYFSLIRATLTVLYAVTNY